jgi:hypothetical protein
MVEPDLVADRQQQLSGVGGQVGGQRRIGQIWTHPIQYRRGC